VSGAALRCESDPRTGELRMDDFIFLSLLNLLGD
jgi:hypothetical protein